MTLKFEKSNSNILNFILNLNLSLSRLLLLLASIMKMVRTFSLLFSADKWLIVIDTKNYY